MILHHLFFFGSRGAFKNASGNDNLFLPKLTKKNQVWGSDDVSLRLARKKLPMVFMITPSPFYLSSRRRVSDETIEKYTQPSSSQNPESQEGENHQGKTSKSLSNNCTRLARPVSYGSSRANRPILPLFLSGKQNLYIYPGIYYQK